MNKSSIVFGGYDKKDFQKDKQSSKIEETFDDEETPSGTRSKIEEESSQDSELLSVNKAHLDIRTNSKMGQSESDSFFDDRQSIKSNMLGSLMGTPYDSRQRENI